jgi:hypothetical protein
MLNIEYSIDIDGDGYLDALCDIGGGGYTARVILGGPQAGKGCQRLFAIPQIRSRSLYNATHAFWKSATGRWRLVQYEQDSSDLSPWLVMYDVDIHREGNTPVVNFTKLDSLYGNGRSMDDIPFGDAAGVVETAARKDWLLVMRRLGDAQRTWVLERIDATEGRFTPTGEQVTGVEFYQPWLGGYSLGTDRPVVTFHVPNSGTAYAYADLLSRPFAIWNPAGSGVQPVGGRVAINDQTGDDKPDLVIAGGSSNGTVILLTLDSTATSANEEVQPQSSITARMTGTTLEIVLPGPAMVSAQLVTTDGKMFPALPPDMANAGVNRFDLTSSFEQHPAGAYLLRIR